MGKVIPPDREKISAKIRQLGLSCSLNDKYLLMFLQWHLGAEAKQKWDKATLYHSLNNMIHHAMPEVTASFSALSVNYHFYIITKWPEISIESIRDKCRQIINDTKDRIPVDLTFYLSGFFPMEIFSHVFIKMKEFAQSNVVHSETVLVLKEKHFQTIYTPPDLKSWTGLLSSGRNDDFLQSLKSYLHNLANINKIDAGVLLKLRSDIYYLFRNFLEQRNLPSNDLSIFEEDKKQSDVWAPITVEELLIQVREILDLINKRLHTRREVGLAEKVKGIIDVKIDDPDITRDMIADLAGISPEYLSRLFHKETGMLLVDYIQRRKIEKACRLFREERLPVSEVASRLGYSNFSYFATIFKKNTGYSPMEYRKLNTQKYKNN
jgi:two-component system response regulator YesN